MFGLVNRFFFAVELRPLPVAWRAGWPVLPWLWAHRKELNDSHPVVDMSPLSLHSAYTACQTEKGVDRSCFGAGDVLGCALFVYRSIRTRTKTKRAL